VNWEGILLPKYGYVLSGAIIVHHKGSLVKKSHRYYFLLLLSAGLNFEKGLICSKGKVVYISSYRDTGIVLIAQNVNNN
jgi:hypothetical protein